ncbi:MAG: DUF3592 domain-containing protein [Magnetococcales bacterium]|nr:DUF3592 domain-containing protein [Magnetococcales bacterium]
MQLLAKRIRWRPIIRLFLTVIGIVLCLTGLYPFSQTIQSQNWLLVEGKIFSSGYIKSDNQQTDRMQFFYQTAVKYEYVLDRQRYLGERVEFGLTDQSFFFQEFAEKILQRYPLGKPVRVYVNPQQANEAVLERTPSMGGGFLLVLLGGFCLMVNFMLSERLANSKPLARY